MLPITGCDKPKPLFHFWNYHLWPFGILYIQHLQAENIFLMIPKSEWSTQWSLKNAQKSWEIWNACSEQNFLQLHVVKTPCLNDAFLECFELQASPVEGRSQQKHGQAKMS